MENIFDYSPEIWPFVFTTAFLFFLFIYSLRRRNVPGALFFSFGCLLTAIWSFGAILEILAIQSSTKDILVRIPDSSHDPGDHGDDMFFH